MLMYLLYWGLLVAWVFLLWPAIRLTGLARLWLIVVIVAGIAGLVYETRMYLWSTASIRLDILVISFVLVCLYVTAALLLFFKRLRASAVALSVVVAAIAGGMTYKWFEVGKESERLSATLREGTRLLFQAKFRDRPTYDRYFGPLTGSSDVLPVGHWQVAEQSHYTRVIVNANGRVWLFYQCYEDAECHSGPGGSELKKEPNTQRRWSASLKPEVGLPFDISMTVAEDDTLMLEARDKTVRFAKAPPPLQPTPAPAAFQFLGPFTKTTCTRAHIKVHQVWLWGNDVQRYAVGVLSTLVAGRYNGHVTPVVFGEGNREGDGWRFSWEGRGGAGTALILQRDGNVILTLDKTGRDVEDTDQAVLAPGGVFSDERIELAPLTSAADWQHWFRTMLVGHFISGDVPAC